MRLISANQAGIIKSWLRYIVFKEDEVYTYKFNSDTNASFDLLNYLSFGEDAYKHCKKEEHFNEDYKLIGTYDIEANKVGFSIENILMQLPLSIINDMAAIRLLFKEQKIKVYRKATKLSQNSVSDKDLFELAKNKKFFLKFDGKEYYIDGSTLDFESFSNVRIEKLFVSQGKVTEKIWNKRDYYPYTALDNTYERRLSLLGFMKQVHCQLECCDFFYIISYHEYKDFNIFKYRNEYDDGYFVYEYTNID